MTDLTTERVDRVASELFDWWSCLMTERGIERTSARTFKESSEPVKADIRAIVRFVLMTDRL